MRPPIDDGVVLITGASSGIGREFARLVAPRARAVVLVARRRDRLEELSKELRAARPELRVCVHERDLADPASSTELANAVRAEVGDVDVLINNAGAGDMGVFDRTDPAKSDQLIRVNVSSVVALTREFVPAMVAKRRGGILNVSSGFGLSFLGGFAVYIGRKHFVTGFTEALRADLAGTGVVVTQVCPGPVATEFEQHIGNFTGQRAPSFIEISPARCARSALAAFERGRAMRIPGAVVPAFMWIVALTPRVVVRLVAAIFGRLLRSRQLAAGIQSGVSKRTP